MKKIKKLSLFITLLAVPFLTVACDMESHYKYEGSGEHSISYIYTSVPGTTKVPTTTSSVTPISTYSFVETNPIIDPTLKNLVPQKIFDCYNDGYRLSSPIYFDAYEYTPSSFVVDTDLNIIQEGTNYYFGKALALYLYDADKDGYRDLCMGYTEGDNGETNDCVSIFSLAKNKEIYHLSEAGILNRGDYHFYADFSVERKLYLHKDILNSSFEQETLDIGEVRYYDVIGIMIEWLTTTYSGPLYYRGLRNGEGNLISYETAPNTKDFVDVYKVNFHDVFVLSLGANSNSTVPASERYSICYRTKERFINKVYCRGDQTGLFLYFSFDGLVDPESFCDIEVRIGSVVDYYKFSFKDSTAPTSLSKLIFGTSVLPSTLATYTDYIYCTHENYPLRDIYKWNDQRTMLELSIIGVYDVFPINASYYPTDTDKEEIGFHIEGFNDYGFTLENKQFINLSGNRYVLFQPFDFMERMNTAEHYLGFTTMTDIIARSTTNPSESTEIDNASEIYFREFDNAGYYTKDNATHVITISSYTFYVINNGVLLSGDEQIIYRVISGSEDFSILYE